MKAFAELIERLAFEPRRNAKITLLADYLAGTPDPDRGYALGVFCGALDFPGARPAMLKALVAGRTDETLFALSYDFVGDLSETIALMWPAQPVATGAGETLGAIAGKLLAVQRRDLPALVSGWLDQLDENGRWALLKLMTGGLRIGVSASLAKAALARLSTIDVREIEEVWHGVEPPYAGLFAWLEGRAARPDAGAALTFRSPMLAHPIADADFGMLDPADFIAEWKWDGIRVQAVARPKADGPRQARLFSRSGDDISAAFPDLLATLDFDGVIDGELVVASGEEIAPFSAIQQRLNRKKVPEKLMTAYPAHLIAYDLLFEGAIDRRPDAFSIRRARLEGMLGAAPHARVRLSPLVAFSSWTNLAEKRAASAEHVAIEGVMLKRADGPYLAGRARGEWFKWKRDPALVDCVMMYAQRGHGRRSSYYSDFTFGVWDGDRLVPVGKAYFGFTDAELLELDRFVRTHTVNRFGPVREVAHTAEEGLVLEIAYEGLQVSNRHKSGIAMRFPRIHRLRRDKKPAEADTLETLRSALAQPPEQPEVG